MIITSIVPSALVIMGNAPFTITIVSTAIVATFITWMRWVAAAISPWMPTGTHLNSTKLKNIKFPVEIFPM